MKADELRKKYLNFFKSKNHQIIPSSSLIPENDATVLFTTAGMHPLVPYLLGQEHALGKRLCSSQKCVRTGDIDEVGDNTHLTFFEMLGNWSLGDYFKKQAIQWSFEFLTKELFIPLEKLAISVFNGEGEIPKDEESARIWQELGISKQKIAYLGKEDNWWGPAGKTGPCGPDTEIFYWTGTQEIPEKFDPKNKKWVEIWNNVFMQYNKNNNGDFEPLKQKNVDTGMGLERITAILQKKDNVFDTELFTPIIKKIQELSNTTYKENEKAFRIIADHIKASVFILSEKIIPSNLERGYVLRRLIRRAIRYGKLLKIENKFTIDIAKSVIEIYNHAYPELEKNKQFIFEQLLKEEQKFQKPLNWVKQYKIDLEQAIKSGIIKKIGKIPILSSRDTASGLYVFENYQTYGVPPELSREIINEMGLKFNQEEFDEAIKKHQELSRTATAGKFKSGLADDSEKTIKYHTATHLLLAALREVLNNKEIEQRGSNITPERIRFDFNFDRKLTPDEIEKIEQWVNQRIKDCLEVKIEEMTVEQAQKQGALGSFKDKYPEKVKVYTIFNPKTGEEFSKEICAGPHVKNTSELGEFKIIKQKSSSQGVRRIRAILN